MKDAVTKLQEDLTRQKLITDTITQDNLKTKEQLDKLQYLVEFVNHFDDFEELKTILNFMQFKVQLLGEEDQLPKHLRPLRSEFTPYIGLKLKEIAKTMGISDKEALKQLFAEDVETMKKAEERWGEIEKRLKLRQTESKERSKKNPVLRNKRQMTK